MSAGKSPKPASSRWHVLHDKLTPREARVLAVRPVLPKKRKRPPKKA